MMTRSLSISTLAACMLICHAAASFSQAEPVPGEPPAADPAELARILRKIADGENLSAGDIAGLDNSVIRVDDTGARGADPELTPPGMERNVYMLRVERGDTNLQELLTMHQALLGSQMTVLKVLALIARHQDRLERRVARTENIQRELSLGMRDVGRGVDMALADLASTNSETADISEETGQCLSELKKIMREAGVTSACR